MTGTDEYKGLIYGRVHLPDMIKHQMANKCTKPDRKKPGEHRDYMLWVGANYYPTQQHFIEEAERMGVSKRLNMRTPFLVPGRSRMFVAHSGLYEAAAEFLESDAEIMGHAVPKVSRIKSLRKVGRAVREAGWTDKDIRKAFKAGKGGPLDLFMQWSDDIKRLMHRDSVFSQLAPVGSDALIQAREFDAALENAKSIFGYFNIEMLEYILPDNAEVPEDIQRLVMHDPPLARVIRVSVERKSCLYSDDAGRRRCGYREEEGFYAVSYEQPCTEARHVAGPFIYTKKPIPVPGLDYFRCLRAVPDDIAHSLARFIDRT